jgi:phage shock protein PspC (stress-responsive transcriptional regulator)
MDSFFAALRRSPLTRSDNRMVAGVCAGVAERVGVSPAVVRIAAFVIGWFTPILAIYLIAVLLLPNRRGQIRLERAIRGGHGGSIALLVLTIMMILSGTVFDEHEGWFWAAGLGAAAAIMVLNRSHRSPATLPTASPAPPPYSAGSSAPYSAPYSTTPPPFGSSSDGPQDAPR